MVVLPEGAVVAHNDAESLVTVVGGAPQWTDGDDGTYGRFLYNFDNNVGDAGYYLWAPFTALPPPSAVAEMTLSVRTSWELLVGTPGQVRIDVGLALGDASARDMTEFIVKTPAVVVAEPLTTLTFDLSSFVGNSTPESILAQPSGIWVEAFNANLLAGQSVALRVHEAWLEYSSNTPAPPLRRKQRDDNLLNNTRVGGRISSRQNSLRNRGYL